jgi:hypothetical protein
MSVREAAIRVVETKVDELRAELPEMQRTVIALAAAQGISGGVVVQLVNGYKERMVQIAECCAAQYAWEAQHDVWPRWKRAEAWQLEAGRELSQFGEECKQQYRGVTKNIAVLSSDIVMAEAFRRIDTARTGATQSLAAMIESKAAEVSSAKVKGGLSLVKKAGLSAVSAAGGYLWHKYMG